METLKVIILSNIADGLKEGDIKSLSYATAKDLINKGLAKEVGHEIKPEITKESKQAKKIIKK
jgi:hypothetical protein